MTGKIHHLNCGTLSPLGSQILFPNNENNNLNLPVCHCLLIETSRGLVLVDTGIGRQDIERTDLTLGKIRPMIVQPALLATECAITQIERLGYHRDDVRHIVLTHMDFLQTGGLADFPKATIHVMRKEYQAAQNPQTLLERYRYSHNHWRHSAKWVFHSYSGGLWHGQDFAPVFPESDQILLIDLPGHSRGHAGVAVRNASGWLLHCGDAAFTEHQVNHPTFMKSPQTDISGNSKANNSKGLLSTLKSMSKERQVSTSVLSSLLDVCRADRLHTLKKLHTLQTKTDEQIKIICSLDPNQFYQCRFNQTSDTSEVARSQMTFPLQVEPQTEEALA